MSNYRYGCNGREIRMHDCNELFPMKEKHQIKTPTERPSYTQPNDEMITIRWWRNKYMDLSCECKGQ